MQIEIRLKKLLRQFELDRFGVTQLMARELKVHRHTIRRLYHSQLSNPSLEILGQVCGWLEGKGVPAGILPQSLWGARPSRLWQAISEPGAVTLFVAEYWQMHPPVHAARWVAQHDAVVMAKIVQLLSTPHDYMERRFPIVIEYVPYRFIQGKSDLKEDHLKEDVKCARGMFQTMRATAPHKSSIVIGSQRVNHLTELIIADVFKSQAFLPPEDQDVSIPFYLLYRNDDRAVPSCFGGRKPPPGWTGAAEPGIYYRTRDGWAFFRWEEGKQDAGIVLIVRDPAVGSLEMAVFGFSGQATEALGEQLLLTPDLFWSDYVDLNEKQVGAYVCCFSFSPTAPGDRHMQPRIGDAKVIRVEGGALAESKRRRPRPRAARAKTRARTADKQAKTQ